VLWAATLPHSIKGSAMELREKYDLLIHTVKESNLSNSAKLQEVSKLFPKFNVKDKHNDGLLTDYILEAYAYARSLGLSIDDAANAINITGTLIKKLMEGEGLSLEKFVALVEAEMYAAAEMKLKHLKKLDTSSDSSDGIKASISFLEKIYPDIYGPRATVTHDVDPSIKKKWELEISHIDLKVKKTSASKEFDYEDEVV
jgi:hypothetical protein